MFQPSSGLTYKWGRLVPTAGTIAYTEFLAAIMDHKIEERKDLALAAFRGFDLDGNGTITSQEMERVSLTKRTEDRGAVSTAKPYGNSSRVGQLGMQELRIDGTLQGNMTKFLAFIGTHNPSTI